jgi:hypothetical protein
MPTKSGSTGCGADTTSNSCPTVTGSAADATPAWINDVTVSSTQLDTLAAPDQTHVSVHALDAAGAAEGVTAVAAAVVGDDDTQVSPWFGVGTFQLTSGTATDGWWEGDITAPQGTPPGTYHLLITVIDRTHTTMYTDPARADGVNYRALSAIPPITVVDSRVP